MATPFPVEGSKHEDEVWAWLELHFRQHRRQLHLFALGVLGNREDAEDATQIVLLNAHRALVRGERPTWPRAWLFAIALNVCRRLRRQASARRVLMASTRELLPVQGGSDAPSGAEISRAFSSLPPGQREILMLRELHGLSYAELSQKLGLTLAAAESRLARARRRLRDELVASGEITAPVASPRRRPLLGLPGVGAALRLVRAPATFKLAAFAGTAAIAPVLAVGLHALPERSPSPAVQAAAPPVIEPVQRVFARAPGHRLSSPAPLARATRLAWATRRRSARELRVGVRSLRPAGADPAPVAVAASPAASPVAGAAEVVKQQPLPAADTSSRVTAPKPAKPSDATRSLPIPGAVQGAVDAPVAAVPVPAVPQTTTQDAVPAEVAPDPPPVVQEVQGVASSAADVLPRVGEPASASPMR
jgi:RNA polymerase sigma-70 factor (ECF subfamily)